MRKLTKFCAFLSCFCAICACSFKKSSSLTPLAREEADAKLLAEKPIRYYELAYGNAKAVLPYEPQAAVAAMAAQREREESAYGKLRYTQSLKALGAENNANVARAYADWALELLDQEFYGAALAMLGASVPAGILSDEELARFLKAAQANESRNPLRLLAAEAQRRGMDAAAAQAILAREPSRGEWVKGAVTVWVDQGFKVRNRMAVPVHSLGSGFFIDKSGYIITNYHVISSEAEPELDAFSKLYIKLWNNKGDKLPATLIGYSKTADLALLKADVVPEYVFSFDAADKAEAGERVFALGSPGGLQATLTAGSVSNAERRLMALGDVIQIDAAVNPGNSGGPLLNGQGGVLGVVFAGIEQFEGVNFALPVDIVKALLPKMTQKGPADLAYFGITAFDWPAGFETTYVGTGSFLQQNGLHLTDALLAVDGRAFDDIAAAQKYLLNLPSGSLAVLEWRESSNGQKRQIAAPLYKRPDMPYKTTLKRESVDKIFSPLLGMQVKSLDDRVYEIEKVYPGLGADEVGFSSGDIFVYMGRQRTNNEDILALRLRSKLRKSGYMEKTLMLGVYLENGAWL